jgi:cell division protein FtsQ
VGNRRMKWAKVRKSFWVRIVELLLVLGIPIIIFLYAFQVRNVTVKGAVRYTPEEIKKKVFQTKLDSNAMILYLKYKYFADAQIPFIEDIHVDLVNTHSVNITVYEKSIVGCVEFLDEYLYFDKDGIVVESTSKRLKDIPLVKGLQYKDIVLHKKLKVQKKELFDVLLNLTHLINKYHLNVDTITFDSNYEVTFTCGTNTVLLGKRDTYDEIIAKLKMILAQDQVQHMRLDLQKDTDLVIADPIN